MATGAWLGKKALVLVPASERWKREMDSQFTYETSGRLETALRRLAQELIRAFPLIAVAGAGILSHFIQDLIPHFDPIDPRKAGWYGAVGFWTVVVSDSLLGFVYVWLCVRKAPWVQARLILLGAFAAYLPDIPANVPLVRDFFALMPMSVGYISFHGFIHGWREWLPMPEFWIVGTMTQCAFLCAFWIPFRRPKFRLVPAPPQPIRAIEFETDPPAA
jgi:hypothetical protein